VQDPSAPAYDLDALLRRYAIEADKIGRVFCDRHAMHPTDLQALAIIMDAEQRGNPITPAGLARILTMSSGAVSAVLDRLERTGHIRRSREATDRRLVHLHYTDGGMALAYDFFAPLGERSAQVRSRYTAAELDTIGRFLAGMNDAMYEYRTVLEASSTDRSGDDGAPE
jgi:DNA-binding MarR family transcriptional regulator